MRSVLYARVSSEKQAEKDLSISAQLKALRKYAESKGNEIVREFVDEAESARTANRPAFQEMIALAKIKPKPFDVILVWKLSRFARNREDSIIYKSLLKKRGIQVVSINEPVDDSPAGALFEGMIEVIDEFYSANLAQDTKRGMRENASQGYYNGSRPAIGYKTEKFKVGAALKNRLVIDEEYSLIVRRIFDMALSGQGAKEIVNALNREGISTNRGKPWSKGTILYLLRNEVYTGTLVWGKSDPDGDPVKRASNHPAIVTTDEFRRLQGLIEQRSPKNCSPRSLTSNYLLSGLIYCGHCNYAMQGCSAKSGQFHYYACHNSIRKGKVVCNANMVNQGRIEKQVIEALKKRVLTEDNLSDLLSLTNESILELGESSDGRASVVGQEIAKLERRLGKLYDVIETGKVSLDDLGPRIRTLKESIEKLRAQQVELKGQLHKPLPQLSKRQLRSYVHDLRGLLAEGSVFEQKGFIRSFVKRMRVKNGRVTIEYTYPPGNGGNSSGNGGGVLCSDLNGSPG